MNFFNTVFLDIIRAKKKTIILFLIFTVVFVGELTSLVLQYSAKNAEEKTLKQIGATITLDSANNLAMLDTIFPESLVEKITNIEHVVGINRKYSDFALPENFTSSKEFSGEDPYKQEVFLEQDEIFEHSVVIEGDTRVDLIDCFRKEQARLICGIFPTEEKPGALISEQLAVLNGVELGDTLDILAYGEQSSIEIIGIYQTNANFEVTKDNIIGAAVFSHSPYNRIYTDIQTASKLFGFNIEELYVDIYVDDPNNVQCVGELIKTLDFDWSTYRLVNTTATIYNIIAANIKALSSTANLYILFVSIFAGISLIIATSLWAERFQYEAGIYLAMGSTRWRPIFHLISSSVFISLPAVFLAALTSKPLAEMFLKSKMNSVGTNSGVYSQFFTGLETTADITIVNPSAATIAVFTGVALCVVAFSCILPIYAICKLKPREILTNK